MSLHSRIMSCDTVDAVSRIDSMIADLWKEEHPDAPLAEVPLDEIKRFALGLIEDVEELGKLLNLDTGETETVVSRGGLLYTE